MTRDARNAIEVSGLGIRFRRSKRQRSSILSMFASSNRRTPKDQFWALRDVSFDVRPGEAIGVVGRNGQGKSTLLKLVASVLIPDEGNVQVNGGVAPLIEITGGFANDLTVKENVRLAGGLHGMTKAEVASRYDEIIDFAELHKFQNTPFRHLSSGMKVRLAFAVVSRLDEPIILVDEVLAVGDKGFREKCYARIDEMLAEGRTLFFVSHNEKDLQRFCTRGLYIRDHRLVMDGPIAEVLEQYNADMNPAE
ncbi:ABC transporter ATP-binding protein [Microbacterium halophytorum]|uniref:ABC transporter ATP-binding protein n=1 Tax=Microbacterium halophytorum TaxID=2067568 RepID=UPI000CFCAE31|nr:ABC transporter ATP-binding protein [Microbacterium halophytorum]